MALFDVTQATIERALAGASLRQELIANNLANANTAGYKRTDVDFQSALADALDARTPAERIERLSFEPETSPAGSSLRADGNDVDVDREMAALSENSVTYQALVTVAKARVRMLEVAIGNR